MITPEQTEALKKIMGNKYCQEVQALLEKRKVLNRKKKPHSGEVISYVFNGVRQNADIEKAIIDIAAAKISEIGGRNEILGIKKPEADTSGDA